MLNIKKYQKSTISKPKQNIPVSIQTSTLPNSSINIGDKVTNASFEPTDIDSETPNFQN